MKVLIRIIAETCKEFAKTEDDDDDERRLSFSWSSGIDRFNAELQQRHVMDDLNAEGMKFEDDWLFNKYKDYAFNSAAEMRNFLG